MLERYQRRTERSADAHQKVVTEPAAVACPSCTRHDQDDDTQAEQAHHDQATALLTRLLLLLELEGLSSTGGVAALRLGHVRRHRGPSKGRASGVGARSA